MKKAIALACALCLSLTLSIGTAFAFDEDISAPTSQEPPGTTELMPTDVSTYADLREIHKVYELSPGVDPSRLPRSPFERGDYIYECADILREVVIGEESKSVSVTETAESKKDDSATVLALFPQYMEYTDEEGFVGELLLNTATIKSEIAGYGSTSTPYTVSRHYPNLAGTDTQYIPKTIDDNGKTLLLEDVQWQTDNTYNADDYEIGNRYTAVASYGGTKTTSYVKGYAVTAHYYGEVLRKGVTMIRYTVIFTGTQTPEQEPITEGDLQAEEEIAAAQSGQSGVGIWLPSLLSALALLGSGACVYLTIKNRKETNRYETEDDYGHTRPYADDADGDADDGDGDGDL